MLYRGAANPDDFLEKNSFGAKERTGFRRFSSSELTAHPCVAQNCAELPYQEKFDSYQCIGLSAILPNRLIARSVSSSGWGNSNGSKQLS